MNLATAGSLVNAGGPGSGRHKEFGAMHSMMESHGLKHALGLGKTHGYSSEPDQRNPNRQASDK